MKHLITTLLVFVYAFSLAGYTPTASQPAPVQAQELPANISDAWLANAQASILESEYQLSLLQGKGDIYQAPNRAHNLRISFGSDRVWMTPRLNPDEWMWGVELSAFGLAGDLRPVSNATRQISENRITYQRDGLIEWYVNSANGIEQGFTLTQAPSGFPTNEVVLEMDILGTLLPRLDANGQTLELLSSNGVTVLQFGQLYAFDAYQTPLAIRMELADHSLRLVVQTDGAVYPITVDPLATSTSWSVESNDPGAQLGYAVASAGDVNGDGFDDAIIAAPYFDGGTANEGRVFVFHGSSTGLGATANWTADGEQANANLGFAVASAGDFNGDGYADVIIGAPGYTNNSPAEDGEGGAFIWLGSANGVNNDVDGTPANVAWIADSDQAGANFGFAVALAGNVNGDGFADVIVGAPYFDNGSTNEGTAFVFHGGSTPDTLSDWSAEIDQADANFGQSVSSAADFNGDGFGDVIVGAYNYDNTIYTNDGSAYVWYGSASGLGANGTPANADWSATGGQSNANFGISVASAGDVNGDGFSDLIVGAPGYESASPAEDNEGRMLLYHGGSTPDATADWSAESNQVGAALGIAVSGAGDVNGDGYADVLAGANLYNNGSGGEGAAFAWFGSGAGLGANGTPANADWSSLGNQANGYQGASVASAGDVNGDGYSDILLGTPGYTNGEGGEGRVQAFYGGSYGITGNLAQAAWQFQSPIADGWLGGVATNAGDVNGDGYDDIIVGAFRYDYNSVDNAGAVFVFYGSANGPAGAGTDPNNASWRLYGNQTGDSIFGNVGSIVGSAGDLNGDGYGDIFVGAYYQDGPVTDEGMVFVWYGSPTGLPCGSPCRVEDPTTAPWSARSGQTNSQFGIHANSMGDVNGDGFDDFIIGARNYDVSALADAGAAFAWYGSPTGLSCATSCPVLPTTANWQILSDQAGARLGTEVSSAGDVNGDGYSDILIGAPRHDNGQTDEGMVFAWYGSAHGLNEGVNGTTANADWSAQGNQSGTSGDASIFGAQFGYTVNKAGDVNGDGYDDIFIGARYYDQPEVDEGMAFIWHGSASGINAGVNGLPGNQAWSAEINQANAQFTYANCGYAGDVNGDGYDDIIIGALRWSNPTQYEGGVFLWLGSATGVNTGSNGSPSNTSWQMESDYLNGFIGVAANAAGDVNGDGYGDVIIGAYNFSGGSSNAGAAYVYYGNASDGAPILPTLRRANNNTRIMPGNSTDRFDNVHLAAWARSPSGRSNVRLQWEIKPVSTAFNGNNLGQSSWVDSTTAGTNISQLIDNWTTDDGVYHWRARLQAQPLQANDSDWVTYQSPWIDGEHFLVSINGTQNISGSAPINLLNSPASVTIITQGTLSSLTIHSYPNTAHSQENANGGGVTMLNRYFSITPNAGASGYNVTLCLNYNDNEIPAHYDESQLNLCRWTGSAWACSATSRDNVNNLICAANVTAFSDWTIGANGPTAIELTSLRAYAASQAWAIGLPIGLGLLATIGGLLWIFSRKKENLP